MMLTADNIKKANDGLPTVDVKGKGYVMVQERIKAFRSICPNGAIDTRIIEMENGIVTIKAQIYDENDHLLASGTAQEKESSSFINKTSYVENCETSAVGRALGMLGIGVDDSMASAEEVANAIKNQDDEPKQTYSKSKSTSNSKPSTDPDDADTLERKKYRQLIVQYARQHKMTMSEIENDHHVTNDSPLEDLKRAYKELTTPPDEQTSIADEFAAIDEDVPF